MELVLNPSFLSSKAGSQNKQNQWKCYPGLSLRAVGQGPGAGGQGFPPATMSVSPGSSTFIRNRRKMEPKELPSCKIPLLLISYTRQLEILGTTLVIYLKTAVSIARLNFTTLILL